MNDHHPIWQERAACLGADPEVFFPPATATGNTLKRLVSHALAYCAVCSVRDECLQYAYNTDQRYGIWGGVTAKQRGRTPNGERVRRRVTA